MEAVDTFCNSISDLHSVRKSLDKECDAGLAEILKRASKDIPDHTGKFLHELHEKKPDEDTLQTMISASPSSLIYKDEHSHLPILAALYDPESARYVPFLAKEGVKYNVGGEDGLGGLLAQDEDDESAIKQILRNRQDGNDDKNMFDKACVDVMKELREANLFTKKDVEHYHLLYHTCFAETEGYMLQFEYLSDWCPEGLEKHRFDNLPLIHAIIEFNEDIGVFATFLKAATKHHMNEAYLLCQDDDVGVTVCERAFEKFGKGSTIRVIGDCIPFDEPQIPSMHAP